MLWWVPWHLKSPVSWLFTQPFIQAPIKENIKALHHWPLWGEFTGDRWIPHKCFHFMTSSWWNVFYEFRMWSVVAFVIAVLCAVSCYIRLYSKVTQLYIVIIFMYIYSKCFYNSMSVTRFNRHGFYSLPVNGGFVVYGCNILYHKTIWWLGAQQVTPLRFPQFCTKPLSCVHVEFSPVMMASCGIMIYRSLMCIYCTPVCPVIQLQPITGLAGHGS